MYKYWITFGIARTYIFEFKNPVSLQEVREFACKIFLFPSTLEFQGFNSKPIWAELKDVGTIKF